MTYDEHTVNQQFRFQNWGEVLIRRGGLFAGVYGKSIFSGVIRFKSIWFSTTPFKPALIIKPTLFDSHQATKPLECFFSVSQFSTVLEYTFKSNLTLNWITFFG